MTQADGHPARTAPTTSTAHTLPTTLTAAVLGTADLAVDDPRRCADDRPSFYADPVAWLLTATIGRTLAALPDEVAQDVRRAHDDVGVIAVSESCTAPTMAAIAATAARSRVSPLRFAGANPSLLAGLPCLRWTFRGPSLVLAMPPSAAADIALTVAEHWLRSGQARYVLCAAHTVRDGGHHARGVVLGRPGAPGPGAAVPSARALLAGAGHRPTAAKEHA